MSLFVIGRILWDLRLFILRLRADAPDRLVLFDDCIAIYRAGQRKVAYRWTEVPIPRVRRLRSGFWRLNMGIRFPLDNVVVAGDMKSMAALRREWRRRRSRMTA